MIFQSLLFIVLLILVVWVVVKLTLAVLKWLAINTVVGLILVGVLNFLGVTHIHLNLISFLIIAVGGVVGVFILIFLSLI